MCWVEGVEGILSALRRSHPTSLESLSGAAQLPSLIIGFTKGRKERRDSTPVTRRWRRYRPKGKEDRARKELWVSFLLDFNEKGIHNATWDSKCTVNLLYIAFHGLAKHLNANNTFWPIRFDTIFFFIYKSILKQPFWSVFPSFPLF